MTTRRSEDGLPSIRGRLSRALVATALAWGVVVTAAVWVVVRHEVDELLDDALHESAEILGALLGADADPGVTRRGVAGVMPAPPHDERLIWQLVDASGTQVLLRSHKAPEAPLRNGRQTGFGDADGGWRVIGLVLPGPPERLLYVAQDGQERQEAQTEAARYTAGAALGIGLLAVAWLRRQVGRELTTLTTMSSAVAAYDPVADPVALPSADRQELEPVRAAIVALGSRLARRLQGERAFTAHAAHALRTPLAGVDAQLALALREAPEALRPRLERTREATRRLHRVVTALLALFRSGAEPVRQRLDLRSLVMHLPFPTLSIHVAEAVPLPADPDLLLAALLNLVDNAVRHGARQVTLSSRAESPAGGWIVRIEDDGAGMSAATRESLQQAIDAQRYEALPGLGLMLADQVARAHAGGVRLVPAESGCVVELTVREPVAG